MTIFSSIGASAFFDSSFLNGSFPSKPVAIKVMPIFSPKVSSYPLPMITSLCSPVRSLKILLMVSNSSMLHSKSPSALLIFNKIHLAPLISLSFNNGEFKASSMALCALCSPSTSALPKIATPPFFITVHTSAKSTII